MPIYEFYCSHCHSIFQFFSRSVNTEKKPDCPKCDCKELPRIASSFAVTGRAKEKTDSMDDFPMDEGKMMGALASLEKEAEGINEDDPRQAADLMRRFASMSGMPIGGAMEEALNRMEAGEDPDSIEEDLGDRLEKEDPFQSPSKTLRALKRRQKQPTRDQKLYDL